MRIGLCLSGGGAKGAFQAGVIKGLYDNGINTYEAISGTSIGAVNGYYVFTDNVEKLEQMWTNLEVDLKKDIKIVNNTVDNTYIIEGLKNLDNNKENIDFSKIIDKAKVALRNKNIEYKHLQKKKKKIMDSHPNLQLICEDDEDITLNKNDSKMLQKLFTLNLEIKNFEEQAIFFLGGREAYFYFKNIGILKD